MNVLATSWMLPLLPLVAFAIVIATGRRLPRMLAPALGIAAMGAVFVASVAMLWATMHGATFEASMPWIQAFGIDTVGQLIHHYPRRYIDRSRVLAVGKLPIEAYVTVIATVRAVHKRQTRRRQAMVVVTISDGTGSLDLTFFNQPWIANWYRPGMELAVSGVVQLYRGRLQLANQEVEILRSDEQDLVHTGRITPVHPATEGIAPRTIRELIWRAFEQLPALPDPLPEEIQRDESLHDRDQALRWIHFPADDAELQAARERLKFDELFTLELGVGFRKHRLDAERTGVAHASSGALTTALERSLPFVPTGAQTRAMAAVGARMAEPQPMNVLLQGDVGAGKTLVALHAALVAIQSGHQAAIMAPTEVLAGQHLRSVAALLGPIGAVPLLEAPAGGDEHDQGSLFAERPAAAPALTYGLLSGTVTGKDRARILEAAAAGSLDLLVGTHALVQEGVSFADLSLAVVDEQHRFGLHQRMAPPSHHCANRMESGYAWRLPYPVTRSGCAPGRSRSAGSSFTCWTAMTRRTFLLIEGSPASCMAAGRSCA